MVAVRNVVTSGSVIGFSGIDGHHDLRRVDRQFAVDVADLVVAAHVAAVGIHNNRIRKHLIVLADLRSGGDARYALQGITGNQAIGIRPAADRMFLAVIDLRIGIAAYHQCRLADRTGIDVVNNEIILAILADITGVAVRTVRSGILPDILAAVLEGFQHEIIRIQQPRLVAVHRNRMVAACDVVAGSSVIGFYGIDGYNDLRRVDRQLAVDVADLVVAAHVVAVGIHNHRIRKHLIILADIRSGGDARYALQGITGNQTSDIRPADDRMFLAVIDLCIGIAGYGQLRFMDIPLAAESDDIKRAVLESPQNALDIKRNIPARILIGVFQLFQFNPLRTNQQPIIG